MAKENKKIIYIELDDELTTVYEKVKEAKGSEVYIVCPKQALLFQSIVNLKILQKKATKLKKAIFLVTDDKNGTHMAAKLGIEVYNKEDRDGAPRIFSPESGDERLMMTPLKASVNAASEEAPTRLTERKISISQILKRKGVGNDGKIKIDLRVEAQKKQKEKLKVRVIAPNRRALIALISLSTVILLFILYVALPGATIYITPTSSTLEKSVNITLADFTKNQSEIETSDARVIASYPISINVSKTIDYLPTGKRISDKAANARGQLTVFNESGEDWLLVAKTRFQTEEGVVFRLQNDVTVPSGVKGNPGKLAVAVVADPLDANGLVTGDRGNLGVGTSFVLPGLREETRSKIYAKNEAAMAGGVTDYVAYVIEEDLEGARLRLREEILKVAQEELEKAVEEKNTVLGEREFALLEGQNAIQLGEVEVNLAAGLVGQEVDKFQVNGTVQVSGIYYSRAEMLNILTEELSEKKSPNRELLTISEDSKTYRIFEWDEVNGKVRLTANIKGIEQYQIDPKEEDGARLLAKIREHVAGMDIEEARKFIQNLPEVNKVTIESWPAWSPTIPSIPDNIEFEIRDAR